jgi:hypothetical protein
MSTIPRTFTPAISPDTGTLDGERLDMRCRFAQILAGELRAACLERLDVFVGGKFRAFARLVPDLVPFVGDCLAVELEARDLGPHVMLDRFVDGPPAGGATAGRIGKPEHVLEAVLGAASQESGSLGGGEDLARHLRGIRLHCALRLTS